MPAFLVSHPVQAPEYLGFLQCAPILTTHPVQTPECLGFLQCTPFLTIHPVQALECLGPLQCTPILTTHPVHAPEFLQSLQCPPFLTSHPVQILEPLGRCMRFLFCQEQEEMWAKYEHFPASCFIRNRATVESSGCFGLWVLRAPSHCKENIHPSSWQVLKQGGPVCQLPGSDEIM